MRDYFTRPNYWLIDGKAYFSVYDVQKFVESFGSLEATKAAMDRLREKAVAAGLKGVHWNLVVWGNPILPVEKVAGQYARTAARAGLRLGHILRMDTPLLARRHLYGLQLGARRLYGLLGQGESRVRRTLLPERNDGWTLRRARTSRKTGTRPTATPIRAFCATTRRRTFVPRCR